MIIKHKTNIMTIVLLMISLVLVMGCSNKRKTLDKSGKIKEAIKSYDKAIELDPKFKEAYGNKGIALFKLGKYEEAIKSLDKVAEKLNPNDHDNVERVHYYRALCIEKLQK